MKKIEDKIFLIIIMIIILSGFLKPIIKPTKINYTENRKNEQLPSFSIKNINNKTFQDKFEKSLADQIPLSNKMKIIKKTVDIESKLIYSKLVKNTTLNINGLKLINGYLIYYPYALSDINEYLENKADNINEVIESNQNVEFYLYYIEKDTDTNFNNNEKVKAYEFLKSKLTSSIKTSAFQINSIAEFQNYFYKTDHHWNYKGSYKAYSELADLMKLNDIIKPKEEICLKNKMSGSKSSSIGGQLVFKEQFCAYKFELPEHSIKINNNIVDSYGFADEYFNGNLNNISYGGFYGGDDGFIEFNYKQPEKENLLIIGESYDNAINELLASHFNKTYNVDLRNYKTDMNKEFNLKEIIKNYDINKILLIGNIDYFVLDTFMIK